MDEKKFVEVLDVSDWEVETDIGFVPIDKIGKTIPYETYILNTSTKSLFAADTHIVIDNKGNNVFLKDLKRGDVLHNDEVVYGVEKVLTEDEEHFCEHMYDLSLPYHHKYYTNGILSHNTTWCCNVAEQYISSGIDVLYVTLEISENEIIKRIDGNLLDTKIKELPFVSKQDFTAKLQGLKSKGFGRLIVKEYPPASINTQTLRFLLDELKLRENFTPTCLIIDYLNLMTSTRIKHANDTYNYTRSVVEEVRGLMVEKELVGISCTQFNRSGYGNSDAGLENTSDSMGTVFGADFIAALIETDELKANGKQMVKQLKSRYDAIQEFNRRWLVQVLKDKQRVEELDGDEGKVAPLDIEPAFGDDAGKPSYSKKGFGHVNASDSPMVKF